MDPPYQDNVTKKVLKAIDKANILVEDGLIICEHHLLEDLEDNIALFRKTDERKYNKKLYNLCMKLFLCIFAHQNIINKTKVIRWLRNSPNIAVSI